MNKLLNVFTESFHLVITHPKLFLPKLVIALLYGWLMIQIADLYTQAINFSTLEVTPIDLSLFPFLFIAIIAVALLDLFINGWFALLVKDFKKKKKVSLQKSFHAAKKKTALFISSGVAVLIAETLVLFVAAFIAVLFIALSSNILFNAFAGLIMLAVIFGLSIVFFFVYPVAAFEAKNFSHVFTKAFAFTKKNVKDTFLASLLLFVLSSISFALAFFLDDPNALLAFFVLRIVVAVLATYSHVLNPVFYLNYK
jgi:hypothetical protein